MDCCDTKKHDEHAHHSKKSDHGHHTSGSCHAPGMSHGSAKDFLRRFWIVTALIIPLALTNEMIAGLLGLPVFELSKWIQFALATVVFGFSLVFFQHAWHEIKARKYGMMTLVSLAVASGFAFSVASTFLEVLNVEFYFEISTLIWVLLFGHYLEARSSGAAGDALQEVAKLLPTKAHRIQNGEEEDTDVSELKVGDVVLVKPGEKIPADGLIEKGQANVDESLISGESKPVSKKEGDRVVAGSICIDGSLKIKLEEVGENSTIGQIQKLITMAGQTKPRSQKIADKASAVLTFVALGVSISTLLIWSLLLGETFVFAITLAITVLVIACPHALGLAIPTVTTIATSLAVKNGVFIKDLAKIETIKKANYVVFDKTGTLTEGEFGVTDVLPLAGESRERILALAASLEQNSSHVIGLSIVNQAKKENLEIFNVEDFKNFAGKGIEGNIAGEKYFVGNREFVKNFISTDSDYMQKTEEFSSQGKTPIFLSSKKEILGIIALSDKIKEESKEAVRKLHDLGVKVAMLTGDHKQVAVGVAKELNIDTYFAEVLPEDKYRHVKELQDKGHVVLMVGDGVNDAPALAQADVGIAIGAGTDVAVESGDVVLTRNSPLDVVRLIKLSKRVYSKMIQNLIWALGYNIVAIPAAAGVFAAWGFFLRPEIGALLMSGSTVIVVANAMTLRKINLE